MLIKKEQSTIRGYFEDASNLTGGNAECVYIPESEGEVAEIVRECSASKKPLTVSAGGTGVVGGRIPFGGAVISTEKLDNVIEINVKEEYAVLQSGVIVDSFLKELARKSLFYPPFPTEKTAFIGGNIATNASGEYSFKFGCTRKYVRRIKLVLPGGELVNVRRGEVLAKNGMLEIPSAGIKFAVPGYRMPDVVKNSAGYYSQTGMDLIDLFIGSEGTLGIIIEAEVDVIEQLPDVFFCAVFFKASGDAFSMVRELKLQTDVLEGILCLEYFDGNSLEYLREFYQRIPVGAGGCVMFGAQMNSPDSFDVWDRLLNGYSSMDTWFGDTEKHKEELYAFRHKLPEAVNDIVRKNMYPKISTDIVVPEDKFYDMNEYYLEKLGKAGVKHVVFGHIGENHLHINFLPENEEELRKARAIYLEFIRKAVELGGTVSGEHGIGKIKKQFLKMMYGQYGIEEIVRVKKAIDRNCILCPGNIFSVS